MEQKQKDALWAQYTKQTHRLGRVLSLITVALLLGAPFVIGALLGAYPDLGATARGFLSVGLVWTVSSVAEFLIYTPMLGAGGGHAVAGNDNDFFRVFHDEGGVFGAAAAGNALFPAAGFGVLPVFRRPAEHDLNKRRVHGLGHDKGKNCAAGADDGAGDDLSLIHI